MKLNQKTIAAGLGVVLLIAMLILVILVLASDGDAETSAGGEATPDATATREAGSGLSRSPTATPATGVLSTPANSSGTTATPSNQQAQTPTLTPEPSAPPPTAVAPIPTEVVVPPTTASVLPTQTPIPPSPTPVPATVTPVPPNAPPSVVAISPESGAIGLPFQPVITITFSESMDTATANSAVDLSGFCIPLPEYTWNPEATELTYKHCGSYPPGSEFTLTVSSTASDASGLEMTQDFQASYRVLREATATLYSQPAFDGDVLKPGFLGPDPNPDVNDTEIVVSVQSRGFLSFDLTGLPAGTTEITGATLSVYQKSHGGAAYGATGALIVSLSSYGSLTVNDYAWNCALGLLCTAYQRILSSAPADGWKSVTVTEWTNEDWQQRDSRGQRSQYQLRFANDPANPAPANGSATFQAGNVTTQNLGQLLQTRRRPALEVTYLFP